MLNREKQQAHTGALSPSSYRADVEANLAVRVDVFDYFNSPNGQMSLVFVINKK